ncbi:MAG TPA: pitrilysin family protein [Rhodocyclaceae bacterium]|nr:pitrilysin family protein [Rhodocyclaceae bacterium]
MKKVLFGMLCLLVTEVAQAGVVIEHWTAPSGARVYFVASRALPMLDVEIDFAAGSAYEPGNKGELAGLAGLANELLEAGAAGLDEEQLAGRLVDTGARLSTAVDRDRASLRLRTLSARPERDAALGLMHAMLATPSFPAEAVTRERARSIAAIQEEQTQPESIVAERFTEAIYPGHPYGVEPTVESVGRISRDDLLAFWRGHYGSRRAAVTIVGDVSRTEAEMIAARLTAGLPDAPPAAPLPAVSLPARQTIRVPHPAAQAHIDIGLPLIRRGDPDFFPLLVGNYVLGGGGFVSRLMKEVREKRGYAYSVYSRFSPRKVQGPFLIGLQTKRSQTAEALKVVDATLARFLAQGPSETELTAAKRNLIDGQALGLDSNAKLLATVAVIGFYGLPLDYLDEFPRRIARVTAAEVRDAFTRHLKPEHLVTVIVGGD